MLMHCPSLQVNSPSEQVVSIPSLRRRFTMCRKIIIIVVSLPRLCRQNYHV